MLNYGSIKSCVTPKHDARGVKDDDESHEFGKGRREIADDEN